MQTISDLKSRFPQVDRLRPMEPVRMTARTLVNALGAGMNATLRALREQRSGLRPCDFLDARLPAWIGRVEGLEDRPVAGSLSAYDSRNNRLAQFCLEQDGFAEAVAAARRRYGAGRVAVILGTSTSGILETELAYRRRDPESGSLPSDFSYRHTHNTFAGADFVRRCLELKGPALAISTACSSSAKVFASAARMLAAGLCDAAVVGGVDSLCLTTLYGFSALELVSDEPCRPADEARKGISIGEGAGFALLERGSESAGEGIVLLGYGESSDAYHMSTPHPEGLGAALAMAQALARAGMEPAAVDYVLLHGTATRANDSTEDLAVCSVLGPETPCSSIKGWIGHTLGAAGIMNALVSYLCIEEGFAPRSLNTQWVDPSFSGNLLMEELNRPIRAVLSNAFGFGGNNASLLFGRGAR
jgi:3-oxoacyl-[acyl-carrier-protein] synthase-1